MPTSPRPAPADPGAGPAALADFLDRHPRLFVLTGAGCSTGSGIPDYRDATGAWKRPQPVQFRDFVTRADIRQRYWARSLVGWRAFSLAQPNAAHRALARLQEQGHVHQLVTQNVDRLHQRAGSTDVIDLHGRLDKVVCLGCGRHRLRRDFQAELVRHNPTWSDQRAPSGPDGDASLDGLDTASFHVPSCRHCGGTLKPDVVFFGEAVPRARVEQAFRRLDEADGMLVVGSSLMVYSGYRYCRHAHARGIPIAAVNLGRTRADDLLDLKVESSCEEVLTRLAEGVLARAHHRS